MTSARMKLNAVAVAMFGLLAMPVQASEDPAAFPSRLVTIVMPFPPGGMGDTLARLMANEFSKEWKQTVIVENRPGASGMIGNREVASAKPDGYTLLIGISQLVQAPSLYKSLAYDVTKDFTPISKLTHAHSIFAVAATSPIKSIDDYIRMAGEQPGKLSYGSYGAGTSSHLYGAIFNKQNQLQATHVAYKGAAPLLTDIMGEHVSLTFTDLATTLPYIQSGKMKAYAVSGQNRVPTLPDIPTFKELGYPALGVSGWYGMFGPSDMPPAIADKISATAQKVIQSAPVRKQLLAWGLDPVGSTREEFAANVTNDLAMWRSIVQETGVTIE